MSFCTRSRNFGTSPQIRHQSASPEPVHKSGTRPEPVRKSHYAHPQFQPHTKSKNNVHVILTKRSGRIVWKLVRKLVS